MSRLEDFYSKTLLLEKVSKKEIDEALKNDNLLVGAEFEFNLDEYGEYGDTPGFQDAYEAWREFDSEMYEAQQRYEEVQEETYELYQKTQELENERDDVQAELDEAQEWYDGVQDDEEKADQRRSYYEKQIRKLETKIKILNDKVQDANDEYEEMRDNWADSFDFPRMGQAYMDYVSEFSYGGSSEPNAYAILLDDEHMPGEPENFGASADNSIESIEAHMLERGMLSYAPFKNFQFGSYGTVKQSVGSTTWAIENDDSLDEGGVEVKSPPMPLPEFMKVLPKMFDWIKKYGNTDTETGFHIHMSVKGVSNLAKKMNKLKMILFMEEGYIWNAFDERVDNYYVKSALDKIKKEGELTVKQQDKVFSKQKIAIRLATQHQDAINFQNISDGHVEFRYLGGTGYHKKLKEVTATIGHFAHNMAIGNDPNFKKKEYAHKLIRIFNKMELYKLNYWQDILGAHLDIPKSTYGMLDADKKAIARAQKEWKTRAKSLGQIYKIDDKTAKLLNKNKSWMNSINAEFGKEMKSRISAPAYKILFGD